MNKRSKKQKKPRKKKWAEPQPFMGELLIPADKEFIKREKNKARELKKTLWWQNKLNEGKCYHCGQTFKKSLLTMDHLTPLAWKGHTIKKNVVTACKKCNFDKKHKTLVEIRLNK